MKNPLLTLKTKGPWILGVSGGPDSMALLSMAYEAHLDIHVVHVNYQKRETAKEDEAIVERFCHQLGIPLTRVYAHHTHGNFQAWARNFRYQLMVDKAHEINAEGGMVGHHLMDDLETFELQKRRKSRVEWYGLKDQTYYQDLKLIRPLLHLSKEELIHYCLTNQIEYGMDESNQSLVYTRNRIRQELISLDESQLQVLLKEKEALNNHLSDQLKKYQRVLNVGQMDTQVFQTLSLEWPLFLYEWIRRHTGIYPLGLTYVQELTRQVNQSRSLRYVLNTDWVLLKHYGKISFIKTPKPYCVIVNQASNLVTENFELSLNQGELIPLSEEDFPLRVQNATGQEIIPMGHGTKKLSRWFIDHKISWDKRQTWPVIYNAKNELIFIHQCGFKKSVKSNNIRLFMLK